MSVRSLVNPAFKTSPDRSPAAGSGIRPISQPTQDPADSTPTVRPPPLSSNGTAPRPRAMQLVEPPRSEPRSQQRDQLVSTTNEAFMESERKTPLVPPALSVEPVAAPDRAVFVRLDGVSAGETILVPEEGMRIGRGRDSDLQIDDDDVSRFHASIQYESGSGFVLYDLGSRNGTSVEGVKVTRWVLQDGDVIRFGPRSGLRFSWVDEKEEGLLRHLFQSSTCDMLTGAHNRKHFGQRFEAEVAYSIRHKTELGLLIFDLDHFKKVNDTYGHPAGDLVLRHVAAIVTSRLRSEDTFARYGGEEFAVLLRGVDIAGTGRAAERLRGAVSGARPMYERALIPVSISVGCAVLSECETPTPEKLVEMADRRLYVAKRAGRNRVESAG